MAAVRPLQGQTVKRNLLDFALWKKASPTHLMRWPSPWGEGFPGWHIECSTIATKYLGSQFDIHIGGMDLLFPHHECEIAQSKAAYRTPLAKYWMHHNMVTIAGKKMGKSLGNPISLEQLFTGSHALLDRAYSPMALRFFILQAHYRSTLSFSVEALQAAERGFLKLLNGLCLLNNMVYPRGETVCVDVAIETSIQDGCQQCYAAMNDDFHTAQVIAALFQLLKYVHALANQKLAWGKINKKVFQKLRETYTVFVREILGLDGEPMVDAKKLVAVCKDLYSQAKKQKQYDQVEFLRQELGRIGVALQDTPQGTRWNYV